MSGGDRYREAAIRALSPVFIDRDALDSLESMVKTQVAAALERAANAAVELSANSLPQIVAQARREGAEAALERAAREADRLFVGFHSPWEYGGDVAVAIRSLIPADSALPGLLAERDAEWSAEFTARADETVQARNARRHAEDFIASRGYRRCDIPACNCGTWHGGHAEVRLRELAEALGELTQGKTILGAVQALLAALPVQP